MSDISFGIRIVDDDGEGVEDVTVTIIYPFSNDSGTTDSDGWVHFEASSLAWNHKNITVYVGDENVGEYQPEDGDTFSFTQP